MLHNGKPCAGSLYIANYMENPNGVGPDYLYILIECEGCDYKAKSRITRDEFRSLKENGVRIEKRSLVDKESPKPQLTQTNAPVALVAVLGHPMNENYIVKMPDGRWRNVTTGAIVDDEDFRAGWLPYFADIETFEAVLHARS